MQLKAISVIIIHNALVYIQPSTSTLCGGHHQQRGKTTARSAMDAAQYEQISIVFGVWPFWLALLFQSIIFGGFMVKLYFIC